MSISKFNEARHSAYRQASDLADEVNTHEWSQIDQLENVQNLAVALFRLTEIVQQLAADVEGLLEREK
ncbi:MAG TPA: hypothetical protein VF981_16620 [Gemmatimonadaceae bacterium]